MPNRRDPYKTFTGFWIDEFAYAKFKKLADELNIPMTEILISYINTQTKNITLTPKENEEILRKIEARIRRLNLPLPTLAKIKKAAHAKKLSVPDYLFFLFGGVITPGSKTTTPSK